jgi:hypothetical protein
MALPEHRQILHGRTHSSPWRPASMDPIEGPYKNPSRHEMAWLVFFLACLVAALLVIGL